MEYGLEGCVKKRFPQIPNVTGSYASYFPVPPQFREKTLAAAHHFFAGYDWVD
jgi:hypothetical protein